MININGAFGVVIVHHVNPYLSIMKKRICDSVDHISSRAVIPVDQIYFLTAHCASSPCDKKSL